MRNLLLLFIKYGGFVTFIILECICFYLIVNYNQTQKEIFINSTNLFAAKLNDQAQSIKKFTELKETSDSLRLENSQLLERIINLPGVQLTPASLPERIDSSGDQYRLIPSDICNKTLYLNNNYFTLCKGLKDGIKKDMGVISIKGVVGKVSAVSDHYAKVTTVLNNQSSISAMIKRKSFFGSLVWDNNGLNTFSLQGIPKYAQIEIGDTVITSGYSTIFPKGIIIGTISEFNTTEAYSYSIEVKTNTDLAALHTVYAIKNIMKEEQLSLENDINSSSE